MRYFIVILLCIVFKAEGQIIRANPFYTSRAVAVSTDTLLLDSFPNAAAAYSLRKLRTGYTGNCIQIRRSSDNTTQNIGFVDNYLDTASMKTFVGNNNGFIRTWYDQSGNGRDGTETTNANQPRIISSGAIDYQNNKPTIFFQSSDRFLLGSSASLFQNISSASIFTTYRYRTSPSALRFIFFALAGTTGNSRIGVVGGLNTANRYEIFGRRNDADAAAIVTGSSTVGTTNNALHSAFFLWGTSDAYSYINGSLDGSSTSWLTDGNTANTTSPTVSINDVTSTALINMAEFVIYISDQTANRTAIERMINRFYAIY